MPTRNVNLPDRLNSFIDSEVATGHFADADTTVCAALELLERERAEYAEKLAWLQQAAQEAEDQIDRGEGIEYETLDDLLADINRIRDEVLAESVASAH